MSLFQSLIDFFGIVPISSNATLVDLINECMQIFVGVYLTCFIFRSLFLIVALPDNRMWG